MKEYLKMSDVFKGELFIDCDNEDVIVDDLSLTVLESFSGADAAKFALHAINSHDELVDDKTELLAALKDLSKAYVRLLESGKDRIESLGGDCDDVCYMAAHDSDLVKACSVIGRHDQ